MNRKVEWIRSSKLAEVDYAYASKVPAQMDLLFMAGACPLDESGCVPELSNYESQAKLCVSNLIIALNASGATLKDVVYTRVLVASTKREDLVNAWEALREIFAEHDVPSTLFGVTVLGYPNQLVEIEAVAAIPQPQ